MYARDSLQAATISQRCFSLVDSLVLIFSDYIDSSEVNRLCATAGKPGQYFIASPALFELLEISLQAYRLSERSFDITLGPLSRLWRRARKEKQWPADSTVTAKLQLIGSDKIVLDAKARKVVLLEEHMQLDFGGIAQGYIADQVIRLISSAGITGALVDVSGDIICIGTPSGAAGWNIGISVPDNGEQLLTKTLHIQNKAVTTSGNIYQYMVHDGKKYSHVIDPRTGYGLTSSRNVTVIANDCTTADWLTKACSIMPLKKARKLSKRLQAGFLIAELENGKLKTYGNRLFRNYWKQSAP
jgi:thiamine biosynthesis lipoprotein